MRVSAVPNVLIDAHLFHVHVDGQRRCDSAPHVQSTTQAIYALLELLPLPSPALRVHRIVVLDFSFISRPLHSEQAVPLDYVRSRLSTSAAAFARTRGSSRRRRCCCRWMTRRSRCPSILEEGCVKIPIQRSASASASACRTSSTAPVAPALRAHKGRRRAVHHVLRVCFHYALALKVKVEGEGVVEAARYRASLRHVGMGASDGGRKSMEGRDRQGGRGQAEQEDGWRAEEIGRKEEDEGRRRTGTSVWGGSYSRIGRRCRSPTRGGYDVRCPSAVSSCPPSAVVCTTHCDAGRRAVRDVPRLSQRRSRAPPLRVSWSTAAVNPPTPLEADTARAHGSGELEHAKQASSAPVHAPGVEDVLVPGLRNALNVLVDACILYVHGYVHGQGPTAAAISSTLIRIRVAARAPSDFLAHSHYIHILGVHHMHVVYTTSYM